MIRDKFNQAKCSNCGSWHWALLLDDAYNILEFKCCQCKMIETKTVPIIGTKK